MRNKIYDILIILLIFSACAIAGIYSGGTGTPSDPYQISNAAQLNTIALHPEHWDQCFILTNDIDLSGFTGDEFNIIGTDSENCFRGKFDGNGHVIQNFTYISPTSDHVALFRYFGDDTGSYPELKNLELENVNIQGRNYVGSLVANVNELIQINNCSTTGSVTGNNYVGGLIGSADDLIINCHSNCDVQGNQNIGGLAGSSESRFQHCSSSGTVTGQQRAAGLVGSVTSSSFYYCFSTSAITGGDYCGGFIGYCTESYIENSYSHGSINADNYVGGFVGYLQMTIALNSYSTGQVVGVTYMGGFLGQSAYNNDLWDCFWDTQTSNMNVGVGAGSFLGMTGKTTAQMKEESTFTDAGWDLINIWAIAGQSQTYPCLKYHNPADFNRDNEINFLDYAILAENWLK